jgi:hypothetical protein
MAHQPLVDQRTFHLAQRGPQQQEASMTLPHELLSHPPQRRSPGSVKGRWTA